MDDTNSGPQGAAAGPQGGHTGPPLPAAPPLPPADVAERLRAGIAALRGGDRAAAQDIFRGITADDPRNENAWIGLALSGATAEEAASALHTAEEINPNSRFVVQAESDLTRRWPGFADALAAARAGAPADAAAGEVEAAAASAPAPPPAAPIVETPALAATPRLGSGRALEPGQDNRAGRMLLSAGVVLLGVAVIAVLGLALANSSLFAPVPPTATPLPPLPPSATPLPTTPPTPTPLPTLPPPVIHVPPTLTGAPAASLPSDRDLGPSTAATSAANPAEAERQAALDDVRAGRYADAIPVLEAASERNPGDVETLYYLGLAYLGASDRPTGAQDAELTFRSVVAIQPQWAPGLDMLARSLIAQGRFADAVPPAYQAVQIDHTRPEYYITLGRAYEGGGDAADAAKAYDAAARLGPATAVPTPSGPPTAEVTATLTLPAGATVAVPGLTAVPGTETPADPTPPPASATEPAAASPTVAPVSTTLPSP